MLRGVPRGFIGISQAGWIVPAAARKVRAARFMVFFSGELAAHGHPNFEYRVYPSYDHFLGHEGPDVLVPAVKWIQQTGVR
jgi:hypothetical protein